MNKRIQWIDVAKGICMISVIAGHMGMREVNNVVFSFHLTVFFILSGYTLKQEELSYEYLNKKFKTLMTPYFFTCLFVTLIDIFNSIIVYKKTAIKDITGILSKDITRSFWASGTNTKFGSVDIGSRIGAIWFFPALFFAIIIVQLVLKSSENKKIQYCIVLSLAMLAAISAKFIWFPFSIQSAMYASPFILLGYDSRRYNLFEKVKLKHFIVCLLFFIIGIKTKRTPIYFVGANAPDMCLSLFYGVCSSICIIYIAQRMEWCKPLRLVGRYSLYFLCVHLFELETMKTWYNKLFEILHIENNVYILLITKLIFISCVVALIIYFKNIFEKIRIKISAKKSLELSDVETVGKRDNSLDIAKGILIILMLIGHFKIEGQMLKIIYSFHMIAFVFYSGYCFNPAASKNIKKSVLRISKAFLIPYSVWAVVYTVISNDGFGVSFKNVIAGISFTKKVFTDCKSVGPVYFILLLYVVRVIYLFIEKYIHNDIEKHFVVIAISLVGVQLSRWGYWLPWSIDCSLYAIIFYHLGYCFKKYNIMNYICERFYFYFLLSCFWAYMIFAGGMEIAIRKYGVYGVTILGSVSASILLYMFAQYLNRNLYFRITNILSLIGRSTIYILAFHTLFNGRVNNFIGMYFGVGYIYHMAISILVQATIATLLAVIIGFLKKKIKLFNF